MRPRFWDLPLARLTAAEWEALCDGCGKCCLNKLEDEETGAVAFTRIACRLLDDVSCRCMDYADRKRHVPECVVLTPANIGETAYFMPETCAYRRLHEGRGLPPWHPLLTADPESPHRAGASLRGRTLPEWAVPEEEWEEYLIDEPLGEPPNRMDDDAA